MPPTSRILATSVAESRPSTTKAPSSSTSTAAGNMPITPDIDLDMDVNRFSSFPASGAAARHPTDDDSDNEDVAIFDLDDAGIRDAACPPLCAVRSVSPSSLGGLRRPYLPPRLAPAATSSAPSSFSSSDWDSEIETPDGIDDDPDDDDDDDDDGDGERYIRFGPYGFCLPVDLSDFTIDGVKPGFRARRHAVLGPTSAGDTSPRTGARPTLIVPSFSRRHHHHHQQQQQQQQQQARGTARMHHHIHHRNRLWREPSPDVWSISEENEEERLGGGGDDVIVGDVEDDASVPAKSKKRVRFVLPVPETYE